MDSGQSAEYYFGFRFIVNFCKLFPYLFPQWESAVLLTFVLFIVSGSNEVIAYFSGKIVGKFYKTLLDHNEGKFWTVFYQASAIYIFQTMVLALISFCSWLLAISLRRNLVTGLHYWYFRKNVYYKINRDGLDNPDQRITQDAERMTTLLATKIMPYFIISPGVIAYYSYKTWKQAGGIGIVCIYGYFLFGTVVNRILVSPITKWTARLEKAEGDFRFKHVSVRNNAEESALYEGHDFEREHSNKILRSLLFVQTKLAFWKLPAQYFQGFFDYYGGVLTYAIQVIPVFVLNSYKDYTPGELAEQISNNAFYFMYLINSFTRLTDLFMSIGEIAGYTQRLSVLLELSKNESAQEWNLSSAQDATKLFDVQNMTIISPHSNNKPIIENLTIDIKTVKTLLITGASGSGKTSIFRVLQALWSPTAGTITRLINSQNLMILPQRPYLPVGTLSLKAQLFFPFEVEMLPQDEHIYQMLESLSLGHLVKYVPSLDDSPDFEWQDVLSPGEQQRLSIARVLLRKPTVVLLDEATSCLEESMEKRVYDLLNKTGIYYISIGHRSSLYSLHQEELHLESSNSHIIRDISRQD